MSGMVPRVLLPANWIGQWFQDLDAPLDQAFEDESEANLLAAMPVTLKKLTEAGFGTKDFVSSKRCDFVSSKR